MKLSALILPIRGLQMLIAFIVLGLSGYVANWYNVDTLTASPSQVNFLIFVPLFTILSVIYFEGAPRFLPKISHPWIVMAIELLNVVFYFGGMIALAVFLNTLLFCRGTVCGAARASAGLAGFEWLLFLATAVLNGMEVFRGGFRRPGRAGIKGSYPKEMKETAAA